MQVQLKEIIKGQDAMLGSRISTEITKAREDADHKFELQAAENRRLQHHLSLQKSEMGRLQSALAALRQRHEALEAEVM